MSSLQQQKLDLMERILGMQDLHQVKAVADYIQSMDLPPQTLSSDLAEEIRLGDEELKAGRVVDWEDAIVSVREAIREGGQEYHKRRGKVA